MLSSARVLSSTHCLAQLVFKAFIPFFTTIEHEQETLAGNIPTLEEWDKLWAAWDMVTLQMIPQEMLHQKPIGLRHKCLFYIGHIPT